jgi:glycosyltransferase involved in cell wall biosynthesis
VLLSRLPAIAQLPYVVVPNFVPDPGTPQKEAIDADIITIGTLEPRKNQRYLLDIVAAARAQGAELRLTVVGDGPERTALENWARRLQIDKLVRFTGFVSNAAQLLGRHRAYIHTATMENMPLTLLEALSRGVPVFAPAVGGIPEIFDEDVEGRVLPLDDASAAARRIVEWLSSPARMEKAGQAARRRYLLKFQSKAAAGKLADFLVSVAGNE